MHIETENRFLKNQIYQITKNRILKLASAFTLGIIVGGIAFGGLSQALEIQLHLEQQGDPEIPTIQKEYLGEWVVTAYYSPLYSDGLNCSGDCRVTASGHRLKDEESEYVVACPKEFPFGTRLRIEGMTHDVWCRDRGGAIKGNRLDLWMGGYTKRQEALNYGIQVRGVYIIREK